MTSKSNLHVDTLLEKSVEVIKDRLYFASFNGQPPKSEKLRCFSIDDSLPYEGFCLDFGPLNLGHTHRFCQTLDSLMKESKKIVYYCQDHPQFRANAVTLIGAHGILCRDLSPDEAFKPFVPIQSSLESFHDASYFPCPYKLTVKHCLDGLYKAREENLFAWPDFNVKEYDHLCDLENGDVNWIAQDKFLAFAGPFEERKHFGNGYYSSVPGDFIPYFKAKNVTAVIRLNKSCYDPAHFTRNGINHYHLFYPDGGNPPRHILNKFMEICEKESGAIAVHCKAGLGRTGTCIGMYLMKHQNMTAKEVIGYFRIVRPGSVIGPQQEFLELHQKRMFQEGIVYRKQHEKSLNKIEKETSVDQRDDKDRSVSSVKLLKNGGLRRSCSLTKVKGNPLTPQLRLSSISDVSLDVLENGTEEIIPEGGTGETQGDVLNKMKALHRNHHP